MPRNAPSWSFEDLTSAMDAVRNGNISIRQAAITYGIPRGTLHDKLTGRRQLEPTPSTQLTEEEEQQIVQWLKDMSANGFGRNKTDLLRTVKSYLDYNNRVTMWKDNLPGDMWYRLFRKRHPEIVVRKPQKLGKQRALITEEMVANWFERLRTNICDIDPEILLDPARIYNADETGFHLDPQSGNVLSFAGARYVYHISNDNRTMITVLIAVSASGHYVHPMLVYPPTQFRGFSPTDIFTESYFAKSDNGWMTKKLFEKWLAEVFIPQTKDVKKPLLLLVDGHTSHQSIRTSEVCAKNGIILYALLAHASHLLQPLDVGVFQHFKSEWREQVRRQTDVDIVTKRSFASVFKEVFTKIEQNKNIVFQGFRKAGIFPLDINGIDKSKLVKVSSSTAPPTEAAHSSQGMSSSTAPSLPQPVTLHPHPIATPQSSSSTAQAQSSSSTAQAQSASSTAQAQSSSSTAQAQSSSRGTEDTLRKLIIITSQLSEETAQLYLTRIDEGFDVKGFDPLFDLWKGYFEQMSIQQTSEPPTPFELQHTSDPSTSSELPTVNKKHPLELPQISRGKKTRNTKKSPMPDMMSGNQFIGILKDNDATNKAEAERKKKRAQELIEKRQRAAEEKERKAALKAEKQKETERKRIEAEEKKKRLQEKRKLKKQQMEEAKKKMEEAKKKKAQKAKKKKSELPSDDETETATDTDSNTETEMVFADESDFDDVLERDRNLYEGKITDSDGGEQHLAMSTSTPPSLPQPVTPHLYPFTTPQSSTSTAPHLTTDRSPPSLSQHVTPHPMSSSTAQEPSQPSEEMVEVMDINFDDVFNILTQQERQTCIVCCHDENDDEMIECHVCKSWYHFGCVKGVKLHELTKRELRQLKFICDFCK